MRDYKLFLEGSYIKFTQEIRAINEYEAREFARINYPTFNLVLCVDMMNPGVA